jgi:hypothetical protein
VEAAMKLKCPFFVLYFILLQFFANGFSSFYGGWQQIGLPYARHRTSQ